VRELRDGGLPFGGKGVRAAVGLEDGQPTAAGLQVASAAAALTCQRRGASSSMPTAQEINEFMAAAT